MKGIIIKMTFEDTEENRNLALELKSKYKPRQIYTTECEYFEIV